jgi:hypothetical protein
MLRNVDTGIPHKTKCSETTVNLDLAQFVAILSMASARGTSHEITGDTVKRNFGGGRP